MGLYAEAVLAWPHTTAEPPLPSGAGWVVVGAEGLAPETVRALFPSPPRLLVLDPNCEKESVHADCCVRTAPIAGGPPPHLPAETRARLEDGYRAVVLMNGADAASGRLVRDLSRCGVHTVASREVGELDGGGTKSAGRRGRAWGAWRVTSTRVLALRKGARRTAHFVADGMRRPFRLEVSREPAAAATWRQLSTAAAATPRSERVMPRHVVFYIGGLGAGGAERQLCNLAVALSGSGVRVTVFTSRPTEGREGHYAAMLRSEQVKIRTAGVEQCPDATAKLLELLRPDLLASIPPDVRSEVLDLAGELLRDPPDVLHGWLDQPNVIAGAAGVLAGVPRIGLSARNLRPTHFPDFFKPWMEPWYRLLLSLPQVSLSANSEAGVADYASWLGVSVHRIGLLRNGLDTGPLEVRKGARSRSEVRRALGFGDEQRVVIGVFRLAAEKAPLDFVEVVSRLRQALPDVNAIVAGEGPLQHKLERAIRQRGLAPFVRLLGVRTDVPELLRAADCMLLTSVQEGTPNVALEAQWLGLPVVATAVGGAAEAIFDGNSGQLVEARDVAGLVREVAHVLNDPKHRERLSVAGRPWVEARFSLDTATAATLAWYRTIGDPMRADPERPRSGSSPRPLP